MNKRRKNNMNKTELVKVVCSKVAENGDKVSQVKMATYVDAMVDAIREAMCAGDSVNLSGFGKFEVVERAARTGVNPQNPSVKIEIPASRAPKFKASSNLKSLIKGE